MEINSKPKYEYYKTLTIALPSTDRIYQKGSYQVRNVKSFSASSIEENPLVTIHPLPGANIYIDLDLVLKPIQWNLFIESSQFSLDEKQRRLYTDCHYYASPGHERLTHLAPSLKRPQIIDVYSGQSGR